MRIYIKNYQIKIFHFLHSKFIWDTISPTSYLYIPFERLDPTCKMYVLDMVSQRLWCHQGPNITMCRVCFDLTHLHRVEWRCLFRDNEKTFGSSSSTTTNHCNSKWWVKIISQYQFASVGRIRPVEFCQNFTTTLF